MDEKLDLAIKRMVEMDSLRTQLIKSADDDVLATVRDARREGATWTQIGDALGITQQAASLRYAKKMQGIYRRV